MFSHRRTSMGERRFIHEWLYMLMWHIYLALELEFVCFALNSEKVEKPRNFFFKKDGSTHQWYQMKINLVHIFIGDCDTQYNVEQSPPSHNCHMPFEQKSWVKKNLQITHCVHLGQCNSTQKMVSSHLQPLHLIKVQLKPVVPSWTPQPTGSVKGYQQHNLLHPEQRYKPGYH